MTENKQIIIDGVDINECNFCDRKSSDIPQCRIRLASFETTCKGYNCCYKQLKRKEQECNKLYIQLKADEEYHKEEENTLRKIIKNKEERNIELFKENNKLKQTLTEIKEIVEKQCNICEALTPINEYKDCKKCWQGVILQKSARCKMTNELEKQFFDTFGIEPKKQCYYWDCPYSTGDVVKDTPMNERDCNSCKNPNKEIYPQITDRILLELICLNDIYLWLVHLNTVDELKNILLGKYIEHVNLMADENEKQEYIHQVQAIFKKE